MTHYPSRARPLAGALALIVGLTFVAPPAFAAEPDSNPAPTPAPTPKPTLAASAETTVEALPAETLAEAAQAAPPSAPATEDTPFIKTGKGRAALVLMALGLGFTIYSFSNDRVKSPNR